MSIPTLSLTVLANVAGDEARTAADGFAIAVTGMLIVMSALLLITLFIASLPRILTFVAVIWPEDHEVHTNITHPESLVPDDEAVVAAIGFVLHKELQARQAATKA